MELFLLIAIGITVISFISIVLTKPSPTFTEELIPEPSQAELIIENGAQPRDPSAEEEGILSEIEGQELVEQESLATIA